MARFGRHVRVGRWIRKDWRPLGGTVLGRTYALWRADRYSGSGDQLDLSSLGSKHPAQLGSTAGADANDPAFLPHSGAHYLYMPGTNGNFASTPYHARLAITGAIDIRWFGSLDDFTPAASSGFGCSRWTGPGGNRSWYAEFLASGDVEWNWTTDGTARQVMTVTPSPALVDGVDKWWRLTFDPDNGAAGKTLRLESSPDNSTWTLLDSLTTAGTTSIFAGTQQLDLGSRNGIGASAMKGKMYRAQLYDGIDGTLVFDFDPSVSFTVDQANAAVITINRTATAAKSVEVTRPDFLNFTDDYKRALDHPDLDFALLDSFTYGWVGKMYDTPANQCLIAKKADFTTAAGYSLDRGTANAPRAVIADGASAITATGPTITEAEFVIVTAVRDAGVDLTVYVNGIAGTPVADTLAATLANAEELRHSRLSGAGTNYYDGEDIGEFIFREALSAADVVALNGEFGL